MTKTRQIQLTARPQGAPTHDDFRTVEVELAAPSSGEVLVRNTVLSVDPYMRGRMNDVKSYVPPFALDAALDGGAVGVVEASGVDEIAVGSTVQHMAGWREHAVLPADQVRVLDVEGSSSVPASTYLGAMGMPGLTAYAGLVAVAGLKEGDTVFVSGAAGAVGSMVGQLARKLGAAKVIGSAGSAEKVAWLTDELGFDVALDYREAPVGKQLALHAPIDVYFDNVGGDHLEAAITHAADHARFALCGAISTYDAQSAPAGPRNMMSLVAKRLQLRGFIVSDHSDLTGEFYRTVGPWIASGEISYRETFVDGLDQMVDGFLGLTSGANVGKMLVSLG